MPIPTHIAIIPDGNRRWAAANGKKPLDGHRQGAAAFETIVRHAANKGIKHLSLWGMSLDNFTKRDPVEVAGLLKLFHDQFRRLTADTEIHERGTRVNVLGRWREKFPLLVRQAMEDTIEATKDHSDYFLNFFLAYNGTDEMVDTIQTITNKAKQDPDLQITPELIKQNLLTKDLPPVDLLIRTAGEPHLSAGFMMWDVADAQLYFTDTYWPEFDIGEFDKALEEYTKRERRLGK